MEYTNVVSHEQVVLFLRDKKLRIGTTLSLRLVRHHCGLLGIAGMNIPGLPMKPVFGETLS